jgi:hypothetical protein
MTTKKKTTKKSDARTPDGKAANRPESEFGRMEDLMRRLLKVPKRAIREAEEGAKKVRP